MKEKQPLRTGHIDVAYVARLARIDLSADEARQFQSQLDTVLEYVRSIEHLDLEGIEPTTHGGMVRNVFREDVVRPGLSLDAVLDNAPERTGDLFRVPRMVES